MSFSILGPFMGSLLCFFVCFIYPASLSFQLLVDAKATPCGALNNNHLQHVVFWIISSWFCCIESFPPVALFTKFLPFYYELKCLLFYWLASPQFKGAGWLWLHVFNPAYEKAAPLCCQVYDERCPPQVKLAIGKATAAIMGVKCQQAEAFNRSRVPSKTANASKTE